MGVQVTQVSATAVSRGELPGSGRTGRGKFDGESTVTAKPSSLSALAGGEGMDVLFARAQEIEKINPLVFTRLADAQEY